MDRKWITVSVVFLLLTGCIRPEAPPQEVQAPEAQTPVEAVQVSTQAPIEEAQAPVEEVRPPIEPLKEAQAPAPPQITEAPLPVKKVKIRPVRSSIKVGENQQFQALVLDAQQKERGDVEIRWASENPSVATVDQSGLTMAVGAGTTRITATAEGKMASATLTIQPTPAAKREETTSPIEPVQTEVVEEPSVSPAPEMGEVPPAPEPASLPTVVAQAPSAAPPVEKKAEPPTPKPSPEVEQKMKEKLERMKKKLKDIDPSKIIYLDSRGNVASTGAPGSIAGEAFRAGAADHPVAMELAELPKDRFGLVNWVEALNSGKINPVDSLEKGTSNKRPMPVPDITFKMKSKTQPEVVFSHKIHTSWIPKCEVCHEGIFKQKAGGNPEMRMTKIAAGQYCGRCHNRVAFPLEDCKRCHVKERGGATTGSPGEESTP